MNNKKLKDLLEYLAGGDPLKDRYDEGDLINELAEDLAKERGIKLPEED